MVLLMKPRGWSENISLKEITRKRKRARRKDCFAATLQQSHAECVAENARLKKEESCSGIEKKECHQVPSFWEY